MRNIRQLMCMVLVLLAFVSLWRHVGWAEGHPEFLVIEAHPLSLREGMLLKYAHVYEQGRSVSVKILELFPDSVIFSLGAHDDPHHFVGANRFVSALDVCANLAVWWDVDEGAFSDDCVLWLSRGHDVALRAAGRAFMEDSTRLEVGRKSQRATVRVDGIMVSIPVIEITTPRGHVLWVLEGAAIPLIVRMSWSGMTLWHLEEVWTLVPQAVDMSGVSRMRHHWMLLIGLTKCFDSVNLPRAKNS